jgi:hypothetical protein
VPLTTSSNGQRVPHHVHIRPELFRRHRMSSFCQTDWPSRMLYSTNLEHVVLTKQGQKIGANGRP